MRSSSGPKKLSNSRFGLRSKMFAGCQRTSAMVVPPVEDDGGHVFTDSYGKDRTSPSLTGPSGSVRENYLPQ